MSEHGHAVVVGGGDAGLLAARVLASHFERVTVVERDRSAEPRSALLATVANVRVLEGCEVEGLVAEGDRRSVAGVAVRWRGEEPRRWGVHGEPRRTSILADLVVDASGRASQAPRWLAALGFCQEIACRPERFVLANAVPAWLERSSAEDAEGTE